MKSFNKTTILLLIAIVFTTASALAYSFFFVVMKNKTEATAELIAKTDELSGKESVMALALATLRGERSNIDKLSSYFIKESEVVLFAKKLEDLGSQSGTTLSIESLDSGLTEKTVPYLGFRIKANGKFPDIVRLLVLLENFPGKFEWKTVRLMKENAMMADVGMETAKIVTKTPQWEVEVFLTARNFVKE